MKLLVTGYARHGKDTVAAIIARKYGLGFVSSSFFVAGKAVRPYLEQKHGLVYPDLATCYADRVNHRDKWFNAIAEYNRDDPAKMGRELLKDYDIYCGLRRKLEFDHLMLEKAFSATIWVDSSLRGIPPEPTSSMEIRAQDCDYVLCNNGTLEELELAVDRLMRNIKEDLETAL